MKRIGVLLMLVVGLALTTGIQAQDEDERVLIDTSFDSATLGRPYDYFVYLPAGYESSDLNYPVVYLLHGRGDDYYAWFGVAQQLDALIESGEISPLIAIMPDMPSSDRASYYVDSEYMGEDFPAEPVETAFFNDLIPHVDATYRTIPTREGRVIGGFSMGGYGAIRYSLAHPDQFGSAIILSPAVYIPLPPADSSTRQFGAFGVGSTTFDEDRYTRLNYPALIDSFVAADLPLYLFIAVGDDEYENPIPDDYLHDLDMEAHLFYNRIRRVPKVVAEFRVYDGGHNWDMWSRGFDEGIRTLNRFMAQAS